MQQSVVKFIAYSHRRCSTCFGYHYAHHQELFQTAVADSGFHLNAEVDVFPAVVVQFEGAPDDGHNGARNMLSGVYATKQ
jgi:hypothetical protein